MPDILYLTELSITLSGRMKNFIFSFIHQHYIITLLYDYTLHINIICIHVYGVYHRFVFLYIDEDSFFFSSLQLNLSKLNVLYTNSPIINFSSGYFSLIYLKIKIFFCFPNFSFFFFYLFSNR